MLILDEPTIGLDASAKSQIRGLIKQTGATLLLTSHDVDDIEAVCERIILLDKHKVIFDGKLEEFKKNNIKTKFITMVLSQEPYNIKQEVLVKDVPSFVKDAMEKHNVLDIAIESPGLETIFKSIYDNNNI